MADRRSLTEGLAATPRVDTQTARDFVFEGRAGTVNAPPATTTATATTPTTATTAAAPAVARVPLTTRIRDDLGKALKRASLERQLAGVEPSTLQEILEEAIEPWLTRHGYLP